MELPRCRRPRIICCLCVIDGTCLVSPTYRLMYCLGLVDGACSVSPASTCDQSCVWPPAAPGPLVSLAPLGGAMLLTGLLFVWLDMSRGFRLLCPLCLRGLGLPAPIETKRNCFITPCVTICVDCPNGYSLEHVENVLNALHSNLQALTRINTH